MKRNIKKYLSSKENNSHTNLDLVFKMYLNGEIKKLLSSYEGVKIYPSFCKENKTIQIVYKYNNIFVTIDFFENKYTTAIYHEGINANDLEALFIDYDYPESFNLHQLIEEIDLKIKNHSKLIDTTSTKKKAKIYSIISWISICLPMLIWGSIGLYSLITENPIQGNVWWGICFIVIPLIIWFIFDVKSKK